MINWIPLHYAAYNGHLSVVEYLYSQHADTNAKTIHGKTPLVLAIEMGKLDVVEFLKKKDKSQI